MLSLVQSVFRFFNVIIVENTLSIRKFDYQNNIITIQKNQSISSSKSVFDPKIVAGETSDARVFSQLKN